MVQRLLRLAVAFAAAVVLCSAGVASATSGGASAGSTGGTGTTPPPGAGGGGGAAKVLSTRGMWIWYVSQSSGGSLSSIVSMAHRYGIATLMIKAGDGTSTWSQFSPGLVSALHA